MGSDMQRIASALERIAVALEDQNAVVRDAALKLEQEKHDAVMAKARAVAEYNVWQHARLTDADSLGRNSGQRPFTP